MSQRFNLAHPVITNENRIAVYMITFDCGMFYIGSSINVARRIIQYRYNYYNKKDINKKVKAALNFHDSATLSLVEICLDEKSVRDREDYHIKLNFENPKLLNRSKSAYSNRTVNFSKEERYVLGNGMRGKKLTPEQLIIWSNAKMGIKHSEEHKRNAANSKRGVPLSESHKKALSLAKIGKPKSEKWTLAMQGKGAKRVDKFSINGEFIATYNSYSEAASSIGCQAGHIGEVVSGKRKSRSGFVFKESNTP